ncbi:MAG: OmpA family protein, partial [Stellaceae bacterium]
VSRYRAAAEALSAVFTGKVIVQDRGTGANPSGLFEHQPAPVPKPVVKLNTPQKGVPNVSEKIRERIAKLDQAYKNLSNLLKDVIDKGQVHIAHNGLSVVIDISSTLLFDSGKADLTTSALGVIDQIGVVLKDQPYSIQVNGFTDNAPIHTAQFNSNWELSALRAVSVVRRFVSDGVDPAHLVGAGYGEYHPVAGNETPENKAKNRRVSIVVVSADDEQTPGAPPTGDQSTVIDRAGVAHPAAPAEMSDREPPLEPPETKGGEPPSAIPGSALRTAPSSLPSAPSAPAAPATPASPETEWPIVPEQLQ